MNSPHTASGYYTIYGEESLQADHFNTKLSFGDPQTLWARTGYLGFVKRTELLDASGGKQTLMQSKIISVNTFVCSHISLCFVYNLLWVDYVSCVCALRSARCSLRGRVTGRDLGAARAALPPH